jgi:hypothetical protein
MHGTFGSISIQTSTYVNPVCIMPAAAHLLRPSFALPEILLEEDETLVIYKRPN